MFKRIAISLAAMIAGSAVAQLSVRPDPADPKAGPPVRPFESAFKDYRPYVDPDVARWRDVNYEVGRLNGHIGHVPQQHGAASKPGAKPTAQSGDGGRK